MMINKENSFVSAVVYINNNGEDAGLFIRTIGKKLEDNFEHYEIIAVNDHSEDNSGEEVKTAAKELSGAVTLVEMSCWQGVQASMNAGVDLAIGDFVFEFDSAVIDYQADLVMEAYKKMLRGFDVVSVVPKGNPGFFSKIYYQLYNRFADTQYELRSERFRLVSRRAINRVESMSDSVIYRKAFYMNCGLKCAVVGYNAESNRLKKKQTAERRELAVESLMLFTDIAYKISLVMLFVMMGFVVTSGIYTVVVFLSGQPVEGWTTLMIVMSVAFFGLFLVLAIVVKYLSMILRLLFSRQRYSVESVNKLKAKV